MTTPSRDPLNFLQNAVQKRSGPGEGRRPARPPQRHPWYFFQFEVVLLDEMGTDYPFEAAPLSLKAGERYTVSVEIIPLSQYEPQAVRLQGEQLDLSLNSSTPSIQIETPIYQLTLEDLLLDSASISFEVELPKECPTQTAELSLTYRDPQAAPSRKGQSRGFITRQALTIEGTYERPDPVLNEVAKVALDEETPEYVAMLYIEAPQPNQLCFSGWSRDEKLPKRGPIERHAIGLAEFIQDKTRPQRIRNHLRIISQNIDPSLSRWLQKLVAHHHHHLCLVIANHTDDEFPWEMLGLEDNRYLGAEALVVRWLPTLRYYGEELSLHVLEKQCHGNVVAYVDQTGVSHTGLEYDTLRQLTTTFHEKIEALITGLNQPHGPVGLVYLATHGMFEPDDPLYKAALGSLQNPTGRTMVIDLAEIEAITYDQRPVFFVNACHSARIGRGSNGLFGLPQILLTRAASGYIGTLGPVGSSQASAIAHTILEAAHADAEGVRLAEVLRQLRAEAVVQLEDKQLPEKQRWLQFIYTFMYVFYGNPLARLKLNKAAEPEADDE